MDICRESYTIPLIERMISTCETEVIPEDLTEADTPDGGEENIVPTAPAATVQIEEHERQARWLVWHGAQSEQ